jgi:hypothetical protein
MQRLRAECDHAERPPPALVVADAVALQHRLTSAAHRNCMQILQHAGPDAGIDQFSDISSSCSGETRWHDGRSGNQAHRGSAAQGSHGHDRIGSQISTTPMPVPGSNRSS